MAHSTGQRLRMNHYWFYRLFLIGWERSASFSLTNHEVSNGSTKANANDFRHSCKHPSNTKWSLVLCQQKISFNEWLLLYGLILKHLEPDIFLWTTFIKFYLFVFQKLVPFCFLVRYWFVGSSPLSFAIVRLLVPSVTLFVRLFIFRLLLRPSVLSFGHVSVRLSGFTRNCSSSVTVR